MVSAMVLTVTSVSSLTGYGYQKGDQNALDSGVSLGSYNVSVEGLDFQKNNRIRLRGRPDLGRTGGQLKKSKAVLIKDDRIQGLLVYFAICTRLNVLSVIMRISSKSPGCFGRAKFLAGTKISILFYS